MSTLTETIPIPTRAQSLWRSTVDIAPGLCFCAGIAGCGVVVRQLSGLAMLSPMIVAIVIGMVIRNIGIVPDSARPGILFSMRRILRLAIILLGLQLTAYQLISVGGTGLAIVATSLASTFLFTTWLGRRIGIDPKLAQLIAAGTSICGASAVVATNAVTQAPDDDVVYAVACVTVFGSLAMLLYPAAAVFLHMDAHAFGLWTGASIHEIAQVVAASFQLGQGAGEIGTIVKLSRVIMLAPMVLLLGFALRRRATGNGDTTARPPLPWFVVGFVAMIAVNSLITIAPAIKADVAQTTTFLLALALAGMGLETNFRKLKAKGMAPLLLAAASWLFIGSVSLGLIELTR
jgi:uncharacterized integral membrane protein (TIGR00698 family)